MSHQPLTTIVLRRFIWLLCLAMLALHPRAQGQTTLLFEGFEGAFPNAAWASVTDTNPASGLAYWDDVNFSFGNAGAHRGGWKGYCAGVGNVGTFSAPLYTNFMDAVMIANVNLIPYAGATLRFWYKIPSIESCCDAARVYVDNSVVWSNSAVVTDWTEAVISLNSFVGGVHAVKFQFHSDLSVIFEGWYLDDIELTAGNSPVADTFGGVTLTNYTGYVIDADATTNNPSYNRESLLVNTALGAENFQTNATNIGYQFTYHLRDTNGNLFPIFDFNGLTNSALTHVATNALLLAAGERAAVTNFASIKPAARLSHLTEYKIEVDVARVGGPLLYRGTNGPFHFYHFTNTVSSDAAYNGIAEFIGSGIERSWLIDLAPGSNSFTVTNVVAMHRYDQFQSLLALAAQLPVRLDLELRHATNNALIPLVNQSSNYTVLMFPYASAGGLTVPNVVTNTVVTSVRPSSQLDSVTTTYRLIVRMTFTNQLSQPGIPVASITNAPTHFVAYNGKLIFGDINTTFNALSAAPIIFPAALATQISEFIPVATDAGTISGEPNSHYGNGSYLSANLQINGDLIYTGGDLSVSGPTSDAAGNVRFQRSGTVLGVNGASADVSFILPAGFGYNTNIAEAVGTRRLESELSFTSVGLNQSLAPKSNLVLNATMLASEESKPVWIIASAMQWNAASSSFVLTPYSSPQIWHVRIFDYIYLANHVANLDDPGMGVKRCNDGYFTFVNSINGNPSVRANAQSNAVMSLDVNLTGGAFRTHFPYDTFITWSNASRLQIVDDAVISGANSKLSGVDPVLTPYVSACEGCGGIGATNYIGIQPPGAELYFTRDGGLVSSGATTPIYSNAGLPSVTGKLAWGYVPSLNAFAQSVLTPTNVAFCMPGTFLRGADNPSSSSDNGPGVMLFTGVAATNFNRIERPLTGSYAQGFADYAGMNVRVLGDNFRDGQSTIAGQNVAYKLRGNSKYYARLGGVSGIHSATGGSFPMSLTLLGYSFTFSNYSLAYLDSDNVKSRTEGSVLLPNPSDAVFKFKELTFTCPGGLDHAEIQDGSSSNHLAYWNADIEALGLQFVSNPGQECSPGVGWLTVGVRAWSAYIADAMHGTLGFNPDGTLIPKSQGVDGVDSRLQMAGHFKMGGPNKRDYVITPVGNAYYNKFDPSRAPVGFVTFAGKMDVPFFEDLKVQVHTTPKKDSTNSPVYLMGGWPRVGSGNPNLGWRDGASKDYFTAAYFDPDNLGFPPAALDPGITGVMKYRNSETTQYHPRAVKLWLDVVDFDYPLVWSDTLRSFKGFSSVHVDLLVIKATHELTYMDAKTATIDFGIQYDGLPKISIANLLVDELGEASGVFSAVSNAIGSASSAVLEKGLEGLNTLLADSAEKLVDELFDAAVDPVIDAAYLQLKNTYDALPQPNKALFPTQALADVAKMASEVSNALVQANSVIGGTGHLIHNIDQKVTDAEGAIDTVKNVLTDAPKVVSMVGNLVDSFASQFSDSVVQPGLDDAIKEVQPSIDQVKGGLTDVKGVIHTLHGPLQQGAEWQKEIEDTFTTQAAAIQGAMNSAQGAVNTFISGFNYATDNPFTHFGPDEFKKKLRKQFKEEFVGIKIVADLQSGIKQRLYDYDAKFKQGLDSYFQQVNGVMRDLISQSLSGVDDSINDALGDLSNYMGAGKISGHAVINDDALRYLRVDGHFEWKVPEKMQFNAFLEIKEIDSENTAPGCTYKGGTATEVTIGANDVDLDWISSGLRADVEATFVIGNDGTPRGLGGKIQTRGDIKFGGFIVKQIGFAIAFGENNNYVAANVRASFGGSVEIAGGVFFGRTCVMTPIEVAVAAVGPGLSKDVNPKEIFGSPPFTGAFVYAEGTFPIWSVGCLFEVRVTVGAGAWYFVEGPKYGGILKAGVGGTVICILSASGDITLIASKKPEGMTFVGTAHVEGCFGPCPFCICVDTSTSVKYVEGADWDAKDPH